MHRLHLKGFESGVYGTPPSFKFWVRQAALYVTALTTMKLIVIIILIVFPDIFSVGKWLLSWTRVGTGDHLQVILCAFLFPVPRRHRLNIRNLTSTMGIFPIIMNVLQFWLIDSIVKASSKSALALDDDASDSSPQDREPLFRAPSDDEDDHNPYRASDIENAPSHRHPRSRSPTRQHDKSQTGNSTPEEYKSGASSSADEPSDHAYPPNPAKGSSRSATPKPAKNLLKKANKRRAAPAPLSLQPNHVPAVNSPGVLAMPQPLAPQQQSLPVRKVETVEQDAWADTWDDSDDWANRVGEEDWTGRRVEQKKDILHNAWNAGHGGAIQVS
ncbi:hypothetical protein DXG03_000102 [Asterophora parasitica]|uniref:Uncharacterized protein n=1 Tax=Asterophora parasitica TaxID=117018 RepID=A0A9P7GG89_9AGAR|nr:hypothetical protein DXG03_000102 [Asterophora parasitica]